jgi:hypothetical protein
LRISFQNSWLCATVLELQNHEVKLNYVLASASDSPKDSFGEVESPLRGGGVGRGLGTDSAVPPRLEWQAEKKLFGEKSKNLSYLFANI